MKTHDKNGRSLIGPDGKHRPSQQAGRKGGRANMKRRVPEVTTPAPEGPHVGRPTLCTPERLKQFVESYARWMSTDDAAHSAGLAPRTVEDWLRRGEAGEEPYADFLRQAMEARAQVKRDTIELARQAKPLEVLGIVDRERWGRDVLESGADARVVVVIRPGFSGDLSETGGGAVIDLPPARQAGDPP